MYKHILLAIDVNDEGSWRIALPRAVELAKGMKAKLHVMTVIPDFGMSMLAQYVAEGVAQRLFGDAEEALTSFIRNNIPAELKPTSTVAQGTIYRKIIDTAHSIQADIIILGAHKPDLGEYLLGPNAAKVARHSDISVLIAR
jgi:nucleotide-binding universal stress UspA family protein